MKKRNLIMLTILALAIIFNSKIYAQQYTLTDNDVVVENGVILSCSYNFILTDIIIPDILDGQTIIGIDDSPYGQGVFSEKSITSVQLPSMIKFIGYKAFFINQLSTVNISNCPNIEQIGYCAFASNNIDNLDLINCINLGDIGDMAFAYNQIDSVNLSDCTALGNIGDQAFSYNNISSFILPVCLGYENYGWKDKIGNFYSGNDIVSELSTFYYVDYAYTFTANDLVVENGIISSCLYNFRFKNINIPQVLDGQIIVGIADKLSDNGVFYFKGMHKIRFPATIEFIGDFAFKENQIVDIDISTCADLVRIGRFAFEYNQVLDSIDFSACAKLEVIDESAFSINNIKSLDLSPCINLKEIGYLAFYSNTNMHTLDLSGCTKLWRLHDWAFDFTALSSVDLSLCTSLVMLGWGVFDDTPNLDYIVLPTPNYPGFEYWEDIFGIVYNAGDTVSKVNPYTAMNVRTPVTFVVTNDGFPVDSATIDFYNGPYFTNESGLLELSNVLQGSYPYTISAEGFADAEGEVVVGIDSISVTIEMSELAVEEITGSVAKVYPNPGINQMIIDLPSDFNNGSIELYNNEGKLVLMQNISFKPAIIQISKLKTGIYFYQIFEGDKMINSGKWVKE